MLTYVWLITRLASRISQILFIFIIYEFAVPVAARSKAQVCGLSPVESVGSNPTMDMNVCLLWVLCFGM